VGQIQGFLKGRPDARPRPITPRGDLSEGEKANIRLFEQASPSVVFITSIAHRRDFFTFNIFKIPQGTGSGFIWDKDGHIVTNYHVIKDANAVEVTLADHSLWKATVVGSEPAKDLAVLRISAPREKLLPITIGSSKDLRVGQMTFAIGNPLGYDHSLTTGVISALGRTIPAFQSRTIDGVIQTEAPINPGSSGGPLLDSAGRLIGINTQIASLSGGSLGIGFAVPVDTINHVVPQLIEYGRVVRPYLGIVPFDDHIARNLKRRGILQQDGVIIRSIIDGGGAQAAGLRGTRIARDNRLLLGDIITKIDDRRIRSHDDLLTALEKHQAGDTVALTFLRDGQPRAVQVRLHADR
jgi:S1-C subfamily serine protease